MTAPNADAPDAGLTLDVLGVEITFKVTASATNGAYSLFEARTPPQGGSPPHYQRHEEESFYVLEGEYTFLMGEQTITLGPGESVTVPREMVHNFTNTGNTPARMLIITSPGGIHEQFFRDVGHPTDAPPAGPPDLVQVVKTAEQHGIIILPPPGP
jgi:mannose-6-phosphate isomerase-like protein (cupin superfamily)